jgi:autotransporter-associated beta strand protein
LRADSFTWSGTAGQGNANIWSVRQNWNDSGPPGVGDTGNFIDIISGTTTPLINSSATISNIVFSANAVTYTFGGSGGLTIDGGIANDGAASQTIDTKLVLSAPQNWGGLGDLNVGSQISGAGAMTKVGSGTLTFNGSNTFTGGVTVNGGKVIANNTSGSATGTGNVTVNSGILGGSGTISGSTSLASGGRIAAGGVSGAAQIGTLTSGNQTWNGGAFMDWQISDATGTAGTAWDLLSVNGTLSLGATELNKFTIDITSLTPVGNVGNANNFDGNNVYEWLLVQTTGGITGFNANAFDVRSAGFSNPNAGNSAFTIKMNQAGNNLSVIYVPEPSTITLGILGVAVIGAQYFRNRKKRRPSSLH